MKRIGLELSWQRWFLWNKKNQYASYRLANILFENGLLDQIQLFRILSVWLI
jgi:hypothetical protein